MIVLDCMSYFNTDRKKLFNNGCDPFKQKSAIYSAKHSSENAYNPR
jgi:hypothetical protein